jgi:hypothetical protein
MLAADLLIVHLLTLRSRPFHGVVAIAAALICLPLHAVWLCRRSSEPSRASRVALWTLAIACAAGGLALIDGHDEEIPSFLFAPFFSACVFGAVAVLECARPRLLAGRLFAFLGLGAVAFVFHALLAASTVHR